MKFSTKLLLFGRVLLAVLFLAGLAWAGAKLDWHLIGRQLASASLADEAAMAAVWIVALFLRPLRLLLLLHALSPDMKRRYWAVWSADMIALGTNSIIPMRAGDVAMVFILRQGLNVRTASVFSAVMVDRFFDLATVIVIFVAALAVAPGVVTWAHSVTTSLVLGLILLIGGLWFAIRLRRIWMTLIERFLSYAAPRRGKRWRDLAHDLFDGLAVVDRLSVLVPVALISLALWGATAATYWFGLSAVGSSVSIAAAAFAAGAVALSFIVPLMPGGFGVYHAAAVLALSLFGVPAEAALAFAIIVHAFQLSSILICAAIALACQGMSLRTLVALHNPEA